MTLFVIAAAFWGRVVEPTPLAAKGVGILSVGEKLGVHAVPTEIVLVLIAQANISFVRPLKRCCSFVRNEREAPGGASTHSYA